MKAEDVAMGDWLEGGLTAAAVNLGADLSKLHSDVASVAVEDRAVAIANLAGVVHDDDLVQESGEILNIKRTKTRNENKQIL